MTISPLERTPLERAPTAELGTGEVITLFARLRWRLLRGAIRQGGAQRVAVTLGLVASVLVGTVGSIIVAVAARTVDDPRPGLVVFPVALVVAVVALGVITGASQPVDPRVIAAEPLSDRQLALGLLTASAFGPPGIATTLLGIGLFVGAVENLGAIVPALTATGVFLATLLLVSRATINVLGLFTSRYPRSGQLMIGLVSLAFYGLFQFAPQAFARLDPDQQRSVASIVRLSPAGQVGEAFAAAGSASVVALGHAAVGAIWLPALAWVFVVTTRRVLLSSGASAHAGASTRSDLGPLASGVRRAWRGHRSRDRAGAGVDTRRARRIGSTRRRRRAALGAVHGR